MLLSALVLHTRPYRESSQLVDLFTLEAGRISLLARGSRAPRSRLKGLLQPFTPLKIAFAGRGSLKTLTQVESAGLAAPLHGDRLFYGLYLNELLYHLLEEGTPFPELYLALEQALQQLAKTPMPELPLRQFEFTLLESLGYAVDFCFDAEQQPIHPTKWYRFELELGFLPIDPTIPLLPKQHAALFLGEHLLAFSERRFDTLPILQAAKRFSRVALQPYLGHRRLKSRELFLKRSVD